MSLNASSDLAGKLLGERKLVAVLYVDMVGYSRLIGADDEGTLARLKHLRSDLIDPAIVEHRGRIVQTGGDSLLLVFDSIQGAVRCAVKVQQQVPAQDESPSPDQGIRFRMGIDIGDAIADGTDLHGDGVIVAARLQAECPPGSVCVSRAVRDHVHDRLDLTFEPLGPLTLKNVARPVDAFLVRPIAMSKSVERRLVNGAGEALPLPDKPSIAVLAFTNMGGDTEQEYFSDGIADDIITELSRSRSLFVIARNSSFTYKGRAVDIKQVARELGVRYVLEGSVRRSGSRVRVVAQLIDAATGNHIWAERYDRSLEDVFAVQDEITAAVVTAIVPAVAEAEVRRVLRKPPESLGAWEAYQRGLWHLSKANTSDHARAREFFHRATSIDRTLGSAHAAMAMTYLLEGGYGTRPLEDAIKLGIDSARKAIEIDTDDAEGQASLAFATAFAGNLEDALHRVSVALEVSPNSAWAHCIHGSILLHIGRPSDGRSAMLTGLRLSPRDPMNALPVYQIALSYYFEGDYGNALEMAKRAISRHPDFPLSYRCLAASLGQLSRDEEARNALQDALEVAPRIFDLYIRNRPPWTRPEDYQHIIDGLRKAGWQG